MTSTNSEQNGYRTAMAILKSIRATMVNTHEANEIYRLMNRITNSLPLAVTFGIR